MTFLRGNGVLQKLWYFLRTYILTLRRFDLFLQGAFLILILLETNIFLLLRRDHGGGYTPASIEDWVLISAAGTEFLLGAVVGWCGGSKRNFVLSLWLALAAASGFVLLFFPFAGVRSPDVELCGGEDIPRETEEQFKTVRLVLLIIAASVCALAKVSIWAHGFTYLDDHDPENGPYFYGILISIRLSLGLSGQSWLQPSSLTEDWWKTHLSISSLTLMFAILFTLFPTRMKEFPEEQNDRLIKRGYFPSLMRVARNRVLVMQTLAIGLLSAAVFGFVHYDKAYVQAKFHVEAYRQDPRTSRGLSDVFRSLVIIFFVMIFRVRFSARRADGVKAGTAARVGGVAAALVAGLAAALAALHCPGGLRAAGPYEPPACSDHCGCDSLRYGYSPVCGLDTQSTFFSPCHAGCSEYESLNGFQLFHNCSCGYQRMVRGACSINDCRVVFAAYQVLYTVFLAVSAASFLMQGMVVVRTVRRLDKPIAVAASFSAVALLAFVCGHLLYMAISYLTCAYYDDGRCGLHSYELWAAPCASAVLAAGSAAVALLASRAARAPPQPTSDL